MKKTTLNSIYLSVICSLLITFSTLAQELLYEIPLATQVHSSSQIIEGKVISKKSFWDNNQQNIYTVNTIEVYKIFKGQPTLTTVEVVTPGGSIGLKAEIVTPSLQLSVGDVGIFMLHENDIAIGSAITEKFKPFASSQGFYKYNIKANIAANPLKVKQGITDAFYTEIENLSGTSAIIVKNQFNINSIRNSSTLNRGGISITNFSPTTVTGGTDTTITINGAGFGTAGTVGFRDANFGGEDDMGSPVYYTALDSEIVSWTNNQIVVEVPSRAGTGDIQVTSTAGGAGSITSTQTLTVTHSEINAILDLGSGNESFPSRHIDKDGNGGYTWQMYTGFDANAPAKESFLRAFETWRCETGVFWELGPTTPTNVIANDDINIIRFDVGAELPTGVLGRCTTRFDGCIVGGTDVFIFVEELDIVFEDNFTGDLAVLSWEFGPDPATGFEVDFESVTVHELGHGHQLAHIINPGQVMHYSIANAQNSRTLGASDITGGNNVHSRSSGSDVCSFSAMENYDCTPLSITESILEEGVSIFPNPAKNQLSIKNTSNINLDNVIIYDVSGRFISKLNFDNANTTKTLDVNHLSTGIYFIKIFSSETSITKKFVIE